MMLEKIFEKVAVILGYAFIAYILITLIYDSIKGIKNKYFEPWTVYSKRGLLKFKGNTAVVWASLHLLVGLIIIFLIFWLLVSNFGNPLVLNF